MGKDQQWADHLLGWRLLVVDKVDEFIHQLFDGELMLDEMFTKFNGDEWIELFGVGARLASKSGHVLRLDYSFVNVVGTTASTKTHNVRVTFIVRAETTWLV